MRGAIRSAKAWMMMDNDGQRDVQLGAGVRARMQRKRGSEDEAAVTEIERWEQVVLGAPGAPDRFNEIEAELRRALESHLSPEE